MQYVEVQVRRTDVIRTDAAEALCEEFAEWIDEQGWAIEPGPAGIQKDRSYSELAAGFVRSKAKADDDA